MKNVLKIFVIILSLVIIVVCFVDNSKQEYVRIHITANSETDADREIKLDIKDRINEMLSEKLKTAANKDEGIKIIRENINEIVAGSNRLLASRGLNYCAKVELISEYCPSRKYSNTTLESGYYDVLAVRLGEGDGDNWWCVMYPPLCGESKTKVSFTSRVKNMLVKLFD